MLESFVFDRLVVLGAGHCHRSGPGPILLRTTASIKPYFQNQSKYNFVQFLKPPWVFFPPPRVSRAVYRETLLVPRCPERLSRPALLARTVEHLIDSGIGYQ
jgi:hypothetical protein